MAGRSVDADPWTCREHVQRRRKRFKTRLRRYVDSDLCQFDVKLKGPRGQTIKRRLERDPALHEAVDPHAREFLDQTLRDMYGTELTEHLEPTLRSEYRRLTLASPPAATPTGSARARPTAAASTVSGSR